MAEPAGARRGRQAQEQMDQQQKGQTSEDSIDAEYGGDYSEATLDTLRMLGKKGAKFANLNSSEEAAEPPSQATCDAAVAGFRRYESALQDLAQHVPDEREREWVDYKRALVEGASQEDLTWLKLKAYYRGIDTLRASRGEDAAGDVVAPTAGASASSNSEQQATYSPSSSSSLGRDAVLRAVRELLPSSSGEESDDAAGGDWAQHLASHAASGPVTAPLALATSSAPASGAGSSTGAVTVTSGTVYTTSYLEEQALSQRLAEQRSQHSQAFALSLAAALGASVVRWWLRRGRGPNSGAASRRPATPQAPARVAQ